MIEVKSAWSAIESHILSLVNQIKKSKKKYNWIVSLNRGGLIPGVRLSYVLGIKHAVLSLESYTKRNSKVSMSVGGLSKIGEFKKKDRFLIVDDIADSGESLIRAMGEIVPSTFLPIDTATIHYKTKSLVKPSYFAEEVPNNVWVVYPWESLGETRKKKQDARK
jgi:hypothetical protein